MDCVDAIERPIAQSVVEDVRVVTSARLSSVKLITLGQGCQPILDLRCMPPVSAFLVHVPVTEAEREVSDNATSCKVEKWWCKTDKRIILIREGRGVRTERPTIKGLVLPQRSCNIMHWCVDV